MTGVQIREGLAVGELTTVDVNQLEAMIAEVKELRKDRHRFEWHFGNTEKYQFAGVYMAGICEGWSSDQWRAAIDAEMGKL